MDTESRPGTSCYLIDELPAHVRIIEDAVL